MRRGRLLVTLAAAALPGSAVIPGLDGEFLDTLFDTKPGGTEPHLEILPQLDLRGKNYEDLYSARLPVRVCLASEQLPRPLHRPFVQMRLRFSPRGGAFVESPDVRQTQPPGGYCRAVDGVPDGDGKLYLQSFLCRHCKHPCKRRPSRIFGTDDFAVYLPPHGGCVIVDWLVVQGGGMARVSWEEHWDVFVLVRAFAGMILFCWSDSLRESRTLHASIGAVVSFLVLILVVFWWITRELRHISGIPMGGTLTMLSAILVAVPAARQMVFGMLPFDFESCRAFLSWEDPAFGLPVGWIAIGVLLFTSFVCASCGARYSLQFFAPLPDPSGDVEFTIGSDGRRIDDVHIAYNQRWLGVLFQVIGLGLLLLSTHSDEVSAALTLVALLKDFVLFRLWCFYMMMSATNPSSLRPLLTSADYQRQSDDHTKKSLERFQRYLRQHPAAMAHLPDEIELRLRRFTDHGVHIRRRTDGEGETSSSCVVL